MNAVISSPPSIGSVWLLTPSGVGAVAVLALEADDLPSRMAGLFKPVGAADLVSRARDDAAQAIRGHLTHDGETLDDGLLLLWPPGLPARCWRGELHLHGGRRVVQRVVLALETVGLAYRTDGFAAPMAGVADRLDAELCRLISAAPTLRAGAWLSRQRIGGLGPAWRALARGEPFARDADQQRAVLQDWLDAGARARPLMAETAILLLGPPNAGKSTLFNALLGRPRSIVSAVPGTTRDWVDAPADVNGLPVRLVDTAGWRRTADDLEAEAIRRGRAVVSEIGAAVVLVLADGSQAVDPAVLADLLAQASRHPTWLVRTHADRPAAGWSWPGVAVTGRADVNALERDSVQALAEQVAAGILPADQPDDAPAAVGEPLRAVVGEALAAPEPAAVLRRWME